MEKQKIMNPVLKVILQEMASRVSADYDSIDFHRHDWYMDYTWTEEEQDAFIEWLTNHLYKLPKKHLKELYVSPIRNKVWCKQAARWFVFNYGFSTFVFND